MCPIGQTSAVFLYFGIIRCQDELCILGMYLREMGRTTVALVISALTVKYRKRTAVDGVSWRLGKGFHALLGPNDAEKSSLLRAVATLQPMASGTVTLGDDNGHLSDASIRQSLGYCPQENLGRSRLTVREHLAYMCWPHRIPDSQSRTETERVTEVMDLTDRADDTTSSRSGGMRRRLGVGSALVGRPSLVVLDEPSAGLDVAQRELLSAVLGRVSTDAITIVSTHIVEDVLDHAGRRSRRYRPRHRRAMVATPRLPPQIQLQGIPACLEIDAGASAAPVQGLGGPPWQSPPDSSSQSSPVGH